jgi:hypothetical protein
MSEPCVVPVGRVEDAEREHRRPVPRVAKVPVMLARSAGRRVLDPRDRTSMLPRRTPGRKAAMADELDEVPAPEDLDDLEDDLDSLDDELVDDELEEDDDDDDALESDIDLDEEEDDSEVLTAEPGSVVEKVGDDADEDEDEEPDDEDVEASLDVILKERLVVEDEPEDDELADVEDRSEMSERVLPKQPDEFVCRSCFLVKHSSQLADKKKVLCRDCV